MDPSVADLCAEWTETGLLHGPILFNLFSSLVTDHWQARVEGAECVGIQVSFKYDQKLFCRHIRNANVRMPASNLG